MSDLLLDLLGGNASDPQLQLLLCLGSPVQLLEDRDIGLVEDDVGRSGVGVPLDEDVVVEGDGQKRAKLRVRNVSYRVYFKYLGWWSNVTRLSRTGAVVQSRQK